MNLRILFTIFLGLLNQILFGQADCKILYSYQTTLATLNKVERIDLPTTSFLLGYITKTEDRAFYSVYPKGHLIDDTLISHLSSDFCMETNDIINRVFKGEKKEYLIRVWEKAENEQKSKPREVLIPIESIKFSEGIGNNLRLIKIDLGEIK